MSLAKVPGPILYFSRFGGEQPIPPEFIAAMGRKEERQANPNDVGPEALGDTIVESEVTTDRTGERERKTIKKNPGVIGPLRFIHTDAAGQQVQATRYMYQTGTAQITAPNAYTTVAVQDLGNGWSIEEAAVEGVFTIVPQGDPTFVPGLFPAPEYTRENPSSIPQKFLAPSDVQTTQVDSAGTAAMPAALQLGTYKATEQQVTQYKKRTTTTSQNQPFTPSVLDKSRETNQSQQIVTVVETLLDAATAPTVPTATTDVTVEQLDSGMKVQTTKTVPEVFDPVEFAAERPDLLPRKFAAALPTTTTDHIDEGMAVKPTLASGNLSAVQKQMSKFVRRIRIATRTLLGLPISLVGKETSQKKQVVTVTETLRTAGFDPLPSALQDVMVENLGDGTFVETVKTVPAVSPDITYENSIDDIIPPEFRTDKPNFTTESTSVGSPGAPALGANELAHAESQVDLFTKKTRSTVRTATAMPITRGDSEFDGIRVGGMLYNGTVTITRKIDTALQLVTSGYKTIASKLRDLGSHTLLETSVISSFPTAVDNLVDPETGTIINRTKTIMASGTPHPGTPFTNQEQIDRERMIRTVDAADANTFTSYIRKFEGFTNVDLPPQLITVFGVAPSGGGTGGFSEGGFFQISGQGSGSMSLAGQAQSSASLSPDVYFDIKQPWGANVPCTHLLFFVPNATTRANILSRCTTEMNLITVNDWPKFAPRAVNFVCAGQNCAATARATASKTVAIRTNYSGDAISPSFAESNGGGGSIEVTTNVKLVRVPPTIHSALSNALGFSGLFTNLSSGTFQAIAQITTVGSGQQFFANATAQGSTTPDGINQTIPATPGQATIPTTGLYLARLVAEPGPQGFIRMHAEIVNFSNIP